MPTRNDPRFLWHRPSTLDQEIKELRQRVDTNAAPSGVTHESVDAIDHVRSIGNVGAHMEKDINLIIDIDPDEAQILIELVEMLFDEWYVARQNRARRLETLKGIAGTKKELKKGKSDRPEQNLLAPPSEGE
jgi:Domain of unknown function (DUF4145)